MQWDNLLNTIINAIRDPIYCKDADLRYMYCNRAYEDFLGRGRGEIIGKTIDEIAPPDLAAVYHRKDIDLAARPGFQAYETRMLRGDGSLRDVIISKTAITGPDGSFDGVVGIIVDITEKKISEERLKLLGMAVENSPASIIITDKKGDIEYVNPTFTHLTGYGLDEVLGKNPRLLKSGEQDDAYYRNLWETILAGMEWRGEFHNKKKNGDFYWESASISPVLEDDGDISHFISIKEDITARKKAEELLVLSEKKLRSRNLRMEEDLKIAQLAQKEIIRHDIPSSSFLKIHYRYKPMEMVGGDYFSFFPSGEDSLGVFLGDVSGHGMASSLFIALLRSETDRIFRECPDHPGDFLLKLNTEMLEYLSSYYITAVYGFFTRDGARGVRFTYANGGHPLPLLLKASGEAELLGISDTLIGVTPKAIFAEKEVRLSRGDRLFLYTDGIPEATNFEKMMIGYDDQLIEVFRGASHASLDMTIAGIMSRVDDFRGGAPVKDDITIIGFEVL
jgi:phosphoserine phosphatase RsbU/P